MKRRQPKPRRPKNRQYRQTLIATYRQLPAKEQNRLLQRLEDRLRRLGLLAVVLAGIAAAIHWIG